MKEIASLWLVYGKVKVLGKVKTQNSEEEGEKSSKKA